MFDNEPSKAIKAIRETIMFRSIIVIAAVIILGLFLAPKITAHELDEPRDSEVTWSHSFEAPRHVVVTVRGVQPTHDDGGRGDSRMPWGRSQSRCSYPDHY